MDLNDLLEETFVEGIVEGHGAAFAVGLIMTFIFGGMLLPILEALINMIG